MEQSHYNPLEDLAYGRTFLPIYAILAQQDMMSTPLIPPILFWKDIDKQVDPQ